MTTIFTNLVCRSSVSAITQTPASGPSSLRTTPVTTPSSASCRAPAGPVVQVARTASVQAAAAAPSACRMLMFVPFELVEVDVSNR